MSNRHASRHTPRNTGRHHAHPHALTHAARPSRAPKVSRAKFKSRSTKKTIRAYLEGKH